MWRLKTEQAVPVLQELWLEGRLHCYLLCVTELSLKEGRLILAPIMGVSPAMVAWPVHLAGEAHGRGFCRRQEAEDKGNALEGVVARGMAPLTCFLYPSAQTFHRKICVQGITPLIKMKKKKNPFIRSEPL